MSVHHVTGNLLDFTQWNVIGQCTNCQNTFGSGLAKQIKEEFPAAYAADTEAYEEIKARPGESLLGMLSVAEVLGGKRVVNLYGQDRYGTDRRHLDYEAIYVALSRLREMLETAHAQGRIYSLGLPYLLGSDRAGGEWSIVLAMIESLFGQSPVEVYIVRLPSQDEVDAP